MLRIENWKEWILDELKNSSTSRSASDVTIQTKEGFIYSHRLLLGSCSTFLRNTFLTMPDEPVSIHITDVSLSRLQLFLDSLLDKMPPERLDHEIAYLLRIDCWPYSHCESQIMNDDLIEGISSYVKETDTLVELDSRLFPEGVKEFIEMEKSDKSFCPLCQIDVNFHSQEGNCFLCCECGTKFVFSKQLISHVGSVHLKVTKSWECPLCAKSASEHHLKGCTYKCCFCFRSFIQHDKLREHIPNHVEKKFKCLTCGKGFSHSRTLKSHLEKEHGPDAKTFELNCPHQPCTFVTKYSQTLSTHVKERHEGLKRSHLPSDSNKTIVCPHCSKSFKYRYFTKYHLKVCSANTSRIVYKCDECGKSGFANGDTLRNHIRAIHEKDTPFECHYCPEDGRPKYATTMALQAHISRKHKIQDDTQRKSSSRMYPCNLCGKLLSSSSNLKSHKKVIHERERGFICTFCNKRFSSKSNLQVHEGSMHTGILPHKCEICLKSFNRKSAYQKHMDKFHKDSNILHQPFNKETPRKEYQHQNDLTETDFWDISTK